MIYAPYQNPACTQPKTVGNITLHTIEDTCDDVHCCYCHGCEYDDQDEVGQPYCVVCGEYEEMSE